MDQYQQQTFAELSAWQKRMLRNPSFLNNLSKKVQTKINTWIPEKIHKVITVTIKQMIRGVLFGATHTTAKPLSGQSFQVREEAVKNTIFRAVKKMRTELEPLITTGPMRGGAR